MYASPGDWELESGDQFQNHPFDYKHITFLLFTFVHSFADPLLAGFAR
jgi:hypothetical protein